MRMPGLVGTTQRSSSFGQEAGMAGREYGQEPHCGSTGRTRKDRLNRLKTGWLESLQWA